MKLIHKKDNRYHVNAWKRYGVLFLSGMIAAGSVSVPALAESERITLHMAGDENAGPQDVKRPEIQTEAETVSAEQEPKRVTLNVADASEETDESAAEEPEKAGEAAAAEPASEEVAEPASEEVAEPASEEAAEPASEETAEPASEAPETAGETEAEDTEKEASASIGATDIDGAAIVATDVSSVVERVMPAMVSVTVKAPEQDLLDYNFGTDTTAAEDVYASGIILAQNDTELLIATGSQGMDGNSEITVRFDEGTSDKESSEISAKVKGTSRSCGLSVLAVKLEDIPEEILSRIRTATLGSSGNIKAGQSAVAIGNAYGQGMSVTCGVISALDREVSADGVNIPVILVDAHVNPGASGGALLDNQGRVIGICIAGENGTDAGNMAYAVPMDEAMPVLEDLINKETRDRLDDDTRGYIGASVVNVNDDAKELYDMPEGAFVYEVTEGSAADLAGIKKGDIITKFAGESVTGSDDLIDKICYYAVGETVTLEIQTAYDGAYEAKEVEVTLQEGASSGSTNADDRQKKEDRQAEEEEKSEKGAENEDEEPIYDDEFAPEFGFPEEYPDEEEEFFENTPFGFGGKEMY